MDLLSLVHRVESATVLDRVAGPVTAQAGKLLGPGTVKDLLSGTWLGHPLHPLLVAVPIGSFVGTSVLDLTGGEQSRPAARRLLGFAVLSVLPTAAAGVSDWVDTVGAEKRVGLVHVLANDLALGLYAASWFARRRGDHGRGAALALVGGAALAVGGYLGGHLAYAQGVGVDVTAFQAGPTEWTPGPGVGELTEGALVGAEVDGVPLVLVRQGGTVRALADRCTHRGGPLHEGTLVDGCVECPWHASRFRLADGSVAQGPATHPQPAYEVRESAGVVQVRRAEHRSMRTNPVGAG